MKPKRTTCSKCEKPCRAAGGRYCLEHHAAYMRKWRKKHPLKGEARARMNARAYLHVYIKRGKIKPQPCRICGTKAQAHHEDYSKPLEVDWLCKAHHQKHHNEKRAEAPAGRKAWRSNPGWAREG